MNFVDSRDLFGNGPTKEIPMLRAAGAPSTSTVGAVGCLYMDTDSGAAYKCTSVSDGAYTWVALIDKAEIQAIVDAYLEASPPSSDSVENPSAGALVMIRTVLSGCDLSNHTVLHTNGAAYDTTIKPRDHHIVGSVYVEVGGVDVTKDVYNPETNSIAISAPVSDVYIEVFCPEKEPEKTVDLVLFSGQSNMSGRGDGSLATVCPEGEGYWYKDGVLTQITGYCGNEGSTSSGSMVSSVAKAYYDATGVPIVAVSSSYGGTKISQFAPDGVPYTKGVELYNAAKTYLEAQGYTIRNRAMVWCQGESDAYDGTSQADYEAAFIVLRDGMKEDCGITDFFMVEIGQYRADLTMYDDIKAAQEHLTNTEGDIIMASRKFVGATSLMDDVWHYTQAAYNLVGRDTGTHMAYYYTTGIRPRVIEFSATDVTDQNSPTVSDELDAAEWDYTLYDTGYVGLNQYIGSAENVTVKAQYKIDGVTYNTALDRSNKTGSWVPIFKNNTSIKSVTFEDGVMWSQNGKLDTNIADGMFEGCTALQTVANIPPMLEGGNETLRSAQRMYYGCTAVVDAPVPENVMNLSSCWGQCVAFTECVELPSTATQLKSAFAGSGIVHVPDIPNSVTTIQGLCVGSNSVESVGVIGSGVTAMQSAFNVPNITGVVRIESTEVVNMTSAFYADKLSNITFEVPADSTTYETLMAAYPTANVTTF